MLGPSGRIDRAQHAPELVVVFVVVCEKRSLPTHLSIIVATDSLRPRRTKALTSASSLGGWWRFEVNIQQTSI